MCRDVRLGPLLVRLQGDQALFAQGGDLGPAAGRGRRCRRTPAGVEAGRGGGRGTEVDEGNPDQLLCGEGVQVVLDGEAVLVIWWTKTKKERSKDTVGLKSSP